MDVVQTSPPILAAAREEFSRLIKKIRPKLHRYCARMTGSVVDAEDVVQDALATAYYQFPVTEVSSLEGWLFRIVHNKAIDYLRKTKRDQMDALEDFPPQTEMTPPLESKELATVALSIYLQLTPMQRSCVILKDVIGYSLAEVSEMLDVSVGAVKAALHRGRENLRKLAKSVDRDIPLQLDEPEASLLSKYVERFNARDFDAVRDMLADDVRLDVVETVKSQGALKVGKYFGEYGKLEDWKLSLGFVEEKAAILVSNLQNPSSYTYFILIKWGRHGKVSSIRDYINARYMMADAQITATK